VNTHTLRCMKLTASLGDKWKQAIMEHLRLHLTRLLDGDMPTHGFCAADNLPILLLAQVGNSACEPPALNLVCVPQQLESQGDKAAANDALSTLDAMLPSNVLSCPWDDARWGLSGQSVEGSVLIPTLRCC
jgi:hypothetical protein